MPFGNSRSFNCIATVAGLFIFAAAIIMGALLLAFGAVPGLQDYYRERDYHLTSTCSLRYADITGSRHCSYTVRENCHRTHDYDDDGCDHRTYFGSYQCVEIWVSFEDTNGTMSKARLFRSYRDAKKTDFECTAYECQYSERILDFKEDIESMKTFKCHYDPDQLEYVYRDDASLSSVIIYFVVGILLIILPLIIGLGCLFCKIC